MKISNYFIGYDSIPQKIKRVWLCYLEGRSYVKNKICIACQHFSWYMASAGVCRSKDGCSATRMVDCMQSCNCGGFKKKKRGNSI